MAIDGFDFNAIADGRVDPDSPIDTTLMFDIRDALEFLQRWLGKNFISAAVADHDHDGVNSKQVDTANLTGTPTTQMVWVDDGTQVIIDIGPQTGLISIASQVPVGTITVQMYLRILSAGTTPHQISFRDPGLGTFRDVMEVDNGDNAGSTAWVAVDSSRQIDRSTAGAPTATFTAEVRMFRT